VDARERLMAGIDAMPGLCTFGDPQLGLFIYGTEPGEDLDIFKVYGRLFARGWFSGLVTEPRAIHMMLSPAHAQVVDVYLEDLEKAVAEVRDSGGDTPTATARYA
jgi:hypothetical protein